MWMRLTLAPIIAAVEKDIVVTDGNVDLVVAEEKENIVVVDEAEGVTDEDEAKPADYWS